MLREVGLDKNAWTKQDSTFFYLQALDAELAPALEITARRFEATCNDLDDATIARERDVVIEEGKLKATALDLRSGLSRAIWGTAHPYGRNPGGQGFADIQKPALCKFIDDHYGPASAVLVVTGNVTDDDFLRIARRFGRIPARPAAKRIVHTAQIKTARIVVNELEMSTALVVYPAPGEGSEDDIAIDSLHGRVWPLGAPTPAGYAQTFVVGEQRERAIVAVASVADAKRLDELVSAIRRSLESAKLGTLEFAMLKQRTRTTLAAQLDDPFTAIESVAAAVSRGERPTRFRDLQQLDELTARDLTKWFDASNVRIGFLLPEVGVEGTQRVNEIATSLHDIDTSRGPAPSARSLRLSAARSQIAVSEHRLRNGLRVLLAPDPAAVAVDARLIITGTRDESASGLDMQAASQLDPDRRNLRDSTYERLHWYGRVGATVYGMAADDTTTFGINGLSLYADWHVWNLGWSVLQGTYDERVVEALRYEAAQTKPKPPTAIEVVKRRLAGLRDMPDAKSMIHSTDALHRFRRARYRPEQSTLIVSGNFDVEAMRKEVDTIFGDWKSAGAPAAAAPSKSPHVGTTVGIEADDKPTLEIGIAFALADKTTPSESVARAVLDEMVGARMRVVRERLGASYGLLSRSSTRATWIVGAVEPAYAAEAVKAITDELVRLRSGDASLLDDFLRARRRVLAAALATPVGAGNRADAIARVVRDEGDVSKLDQRADELRSLEFAEVQKLAARDLQPNRMIAAVRGKKQAVEAALGALGVAKEKIEWLAPAKANGRDQRGSEETPKLTIR